MKFNRYFYIFLVLVFISQIKTFDTFLSINIMEASNLHCKLNNELFCNPYAEISFKYSTVLKTTKFSVCNKSPYFNSKFSFEPEICEDEEIYISLYQYMTPRDSNYLQEKAYDEQYYDKGDIKPGYLGRIVLKLKHLPFGISEDWYMIEENLINDRVVFPSCIKLRISYTSKKCNEGSSLYKLHMLDNGQFFKHLGFKLDFRLPKNFDDLLEEMKRKKKLVKNKLNYNVESILLPRCKVEFASIYRNAFTKLKASTGQKLDFEDLSSFDPNEDYDYRACTADPNKDYGFEHKSNLTFIEESLVFKIIKRITGKDVFSKIEKDNEIQTNYNEFNYENYDDFYKKECYEKNLTIEEINSILKEECSNFPLDTKNPYIDKGHNPDKQPSYPEKLTRLRLNKVFSNTLDSYISAENTNYINDFKDDFSVISSTNKISEILKKIEETNKEDETMFDHKNQVTYKINGDINEKERNILRIYALYKWNGGHLEYSTIKREFYLRRKYFKCYEQVKIVPTNILNHFTEDKCPDNYVCLDPNGNVILSDGKDPKEIFKEDLKNNGIDLFDVDKILKAREAKIKRTIKITNLNPTSKSNLKSISEQRNLHQENSKPKSVELFKENVSKNIIANKVSSFIEIDEKFDEEKLNNKNDFLRLLIEESGEQFPNNNFLSYNIDTIFLNKFDKMFFSRRNRIKNKKTVITTKVFDCIPIIGEMLQLSSMDQLLLEEKINPDFIKKELTVFKKYLLLYDANGNYIDKASKILLNLVLCRVDYYKLRNILNDLLEGLCYGDPISMKIYREILHHVILDTLFKLSFFELEDIEAKVNLISTFNKKFCIPTFKKVTFIENMLLLKEVKQQIIFMIVNTDSNEKVSLRLGEVKKSIPMLINNNKRELEFDYNGNLIKDNATYSNHFVEDLKKNIVFESKDYQKELQYGTYKFKEINMNLESKFDEIKPLLNRSIMKEINNSIEAEFKEFDSTINLKEDSSLNNHKDNVNIRFKQDDHNQNQNQAENQDTNDLSSSSTQKKDQNITTYIISKKDQSKIPNDEALIKEIINKPDVKKILNEGNSKINTLPESNNIKTTYQIQKTTTKTVEKKNKTKELILKNLMSENEFNDLIKQGKDFKETPDSKLYNILNKIQNKPCSNGFLCVEVGTITGDFDSLKDKKFEVKVKKSENVNLIVKPLIIKQENQNKKIENPNSQNNDDCLDGNVLNELSVGVSENKSKIFFIDLISNVNSNVINEQINKTNTQINSSFIENSNILKSKKTDTKTYQNKKENKFYRKVQIGNTLLSTEIFKEGINLIIVNRNKFYTKAYEQTFDTHNNFQESENLATILKNLTYDKIAILTAIGSWTGKVSISLINEIKQIGGPDLSNLIKDIEDKEIEMKMNHVILKENLYLEVIGRRGLCRYNGYFDSHLKITNIDDGVIKEKINHNKNLFINDVKNIDENEVLTNSNNSEGKQLNNSENDFVYKVDSKFEISLNEDSSLGFESPTVISVSPNNGNLLGGTNVTIKGLNFYSNSDFPTQVFVRGVVCSNVSVISQNEISCITKSAKIVGAGLGNILIRGKDRSSPFNTCFHYKYLNNIIKTQSIDYPVVHNIVMPLPANNMLIHPPVINPDLTIKTSILDPYSRFKQIDNLEENKRIDEKIRTTDLRYLRLPEDRIMINEVPNSLSLERVNDSNKNLFANSFSKKVDSFRKNRFRKIIQGLDSNN